MSPSPIDIVITAALEHAASVAQLARHVSEVDGPERAQPLSKHSLEILEAVEAVRP